MSQAFCPLVKSLKSLREKISKYIFSINTIQFPNFSWDTFFAKWKIKKKIINRGYDQQATKKSHPNQISTPKIGFLVGVKTFE